METYFPGTYTDGSCVFESVMKNEDVIKFTVLI